MGGSLLLLLLLCGLPGEACAQEGRGSRGKPGAEGETFLTTVPPSRGSIILGRPTDRSVTLSLLLSEASRVRVAYGPAGKEARRRTESIAVEAGTPREILLEGLAPDTAYAYRVLEAESGKPLLPEREEGRFQTCRPPGSPFTFTLQADSHLDGGCLPELYEASLRNAVADRPDFHIDLGDTFMTGKHASRETAALQYLAQRHYLGEIAQDAPLFLVIGNHDGEENLRPEHAGRDGLAVWSCLQRKRYFPNPLPGPFYGGNTEENPYAGALQNFYSWSWGDALFVVLDPYWTSRSTRGGREPWNMSLGRAQFDWLARTLRASKAKFRFLFIHQLVGGIGSGGRGGAEAAPLYEWGGREADGSQTFALHRPGWEKPVHDLLVETGVSVVFHGHDHFFARQERDGVVYQLVPQPAHRSVRNHQAAEYGYQKGEFLAGCGHLRVRVDPLQSTVEFVRAATPEMEGRGLRNGEVAFRYLLPAR